MESLALFLLMAFLANRNAGGNAGQPTGPRRRPATRPATQRPATPGPGATKPAVSVLPAPTPQQAAQAKKQAPPWPQAMPSGLPPWPAGWQPAQPPPAPVVTRAWQLLPTLWQKGAGNRVTEQTAGNWYTYVASWMNAAKTMKGVVAFKPKGGAPRPASRSSTANA